MFVRKPAVADLFYPGDANELNRYLESVVKDVQPKVKPRAIIVPHAGYVYSGHVAAKAYSVIEPFDTYIIMGPNHTGLGAEISVFDGVYSMPFGAVYPDEELIQRIAENSYVEIDYYAHLQEHSIEVQLPFIDYITPNSYKVVTIVVGTHNISKLYSVAETMAEAIKNSERNVLMVVSSDMNHYENHEITLKKDQLVIDALSRLDENEMMRVCQYHNITMCGVGPAYIAVSASKLLGAHKFTVLDHRTSGEVNGDYSQVVGYLSALIE